MEVLTELNVRLDVPAMTPVVPSMKVPAEPMVTKVPPPVPPPSVPARFSVPAVTVVPPV